MVAATKNGAVVDQDLNETKRKLVSKSALRVINLDTISFDPSYQREVKSKHKRIVTSFNPDALGIILVAEREDGSLWCVDGRQRITALLKMGRKTVRAELFKSDGPEHEAMVFKLVNMNRMPLNPQEEFKALLTAGDKLAWQIKETVEKCGYKITLSSRGRPRDERGNNEVNAINCLMRNCRKYGTEPLKFCLETIKAAWPDDRIANTNGMLAGLMLLHVRFKGIVDNERLLQRLRAVTPHKILYQASQEVLSKNQWAAIADVLERLYKKRSQSKK